MERRHFIRLLGGTMLAAGPLRAAAQASRAPAIDVVDAFGFVADGRTDNYEAFRRWIAHVNRARGGHYVFPAGTYVVRQHRTRNFSRHPDLNPVIDRCDGLTISGHGARIRLNGAFHRGAGRGRGQAPSDLAIFMPFAIHRSRNVVIRGFEIDGGVRDMSRDDSVNEAYASLIALHGCTNARLEDLDLHHCQTDGLYLTSSELGGRPGIACRDIVVRRVKSYNNARGGLGVIQVYGLLVEDSAFDGNGEGLGRYKAHAPRFGVDIEPDYKRRQDVDILTGNIEFRRCRFMDNTSALLAAYRDRYQGYLRLIDCRSSNRTGGPYHMILSWDGALVEGGAHDAGAGAVYLSWQGQTGGNLTVRNAEFRTAGLYGLMHTAAGNAVALEGVKVIGAHRSPGSHGSVLLMQADPGGGRRNRMRGCDIFVPAARKSRDHAYDYEVTLHHTVSEGNLFRTDLPAAGGQHFCTDYGARTTARRDMYRGTAPGPNDSFRPGHNSRHDTRQPYAKG
ncbi:MAG: hypothetical protein ACK40O_05380 [Allosphingosinicella sp.]